MVVQVILCLGSETVRIQEATFQSIRMSHNLHDLIKDGSLMIQCKD